MHTLRFAGVAFVLFVTASVGCGDKPQPQPPVGCPQVCAPPFSDASKADGGVYDAGPGEPFEADQSAEALGLASPCARACKAFSLLGCPEARRLPGGRTCVETCKEIASISSFDPYCVAKAASVVIVRGCPKVKCELPAASAAPAH